MPIEQMRLVCQAVTLHNPTNDKLKSLGITHKATVSVLKRLKGGNDSIL